MAAVKGLQKVLRFVSKSEQNCFDVPLWRRSVSLYEVNSNFEGINACTKNIQSDDENFDLYYEFSSVGS